jgi:hypothetical protein
MLTVLTSLNIAQHVGDILIAGIFSWNVPSHLGSGLSLSVPQAPPFEWMRF